MRIKYLLWAVCTLGILFFQTSCTADEVPEPEVKPFCDSLTITFDSHIDTLFVSNCIKCHNPRGTFPDLTDYSNLNSAIFQDIFDEVSTGSMPQDKVMTIEEIQLIECWKDDGFLEK